MLTVVDKMYSYSFTLRAAHMLIKHGTLALLIFVGLICKVYAATGWCRAENGTYQYNFSTNTVITNPAQNRPGLSIDPAYTWNLGGGYSLICDCDASHTNASRTYKGIVPALTPYKTIGKRNYFNLNKYLAVAVDIYIGGSLNQYFQVPFTDVQNGATAGCTYPQPPESDSGSKGHLALYLKQPFVGEVVIPSTPVGQLFVSKVKGSYPPVPVSQVNMSGTVTVPQSCKINDGQVIDVDFGTLMNTDIKTKGSVPTGFTKKVTQLAYVCTNISEGVLLSFTFNGQASPDDPDSLATNNADVGVRLESMNGSTITPNIGKLPAQFDYSTQSGSTSFQSYPVNTTGNTPATGAFSSTATITTNME
jgi:type 1 fimbria pilin